MGEKCRGREAVALIRLHFIVEGQTEEGFVNDLLAPELSQHGIFADASLVTTGRNHGRQFKGGLLKYEHLARDLQRRMKQDQAADSWFTTMFDFFRLPTDFPGTSHVPKSHPARDRVACLEQSLIEDLTQRLGDLSVCRRLIPYIQLHEFEALMFSDPSGFQAAYPNNPTSVDRLHRIRTAFHSPEDINEGDATAPSKRILDVLPDYQKPVDGLLVAQRIGLAKMRKECTHFGEWVDRLLALSPNASELAGVTRP